MIKQCEVCEKEYRANSNGRFCSTACYSKTVPSQYTKNKMKLEQLRELVTTDHETKQQFIDRVNNILAV